MDPLHNELEELKTFISDLKADRTAQKEKEKREAWTKYTSLSLVLLGASPTHRPLPLGRRRGG